MNSLEDGAEVLRPQAWRRKCGWSGCIAFLPTCSVLRPKSPERSLDLAHQVPSRTVSEIPPHLWSTQPAAPAALGVPPGCGSRTTWQGAPLAKVSSAGSNHQLRPPGSHPRLSLYVHSSEGHRPQHLLHTTPGSHEHSRFPGKAEGKGEWDRCGGSLSASAADDAIGGGGSKPPPQKKKKK